MSWQRIHRADGRVELVCPHGIGHVSKRLTETRRRWQDWMQVHSCDGCCADAQAFAAAESESEREWFERLRGGKS